MDMDKTGSMGGAFVALVLAAALGVQAAPAVELTPEERAKAEQRMSELSREMGELGRKLGEDRRVRIIEDRRVAMNRAMLGINVDDDASTSKGDGVHVAAVTPRGPAAAAGLRAGDVLLSMDGKALKKDGTETPYEKLRHQMEAKDPGAEAKLKVLREGKTIELAVKTEAYAPRSFGFGLGSLGGLGELEMLAPPRGPMPPMPPMVPGGAERDGHGMDRFRWFTREWGDLEMVSLTPKLGEYFGAKEGVLVVHAPDDAAIKLQDGDVITKVGDRKPASPEQVLRILRSYDAGDSLKVEILRGRKPVTVEVVIPDRRTGMRAREERSADGTLEIFVSP